MLTRTQFLLSCAAAAARFSQAQDFSTSVRVVNVFVTVRNRDKQLVRGLTREQFTLTEDGRRRQIHYFAAQSDLPLTLGLLFDASGSQRTVVEAQQRASEVFARQLLRSGDRSFLIAFNRQVSLVESGDGIVLSGDNSRGTALYDAVVAASRQASKHVGRKAAVILSDGIDTASTAALDDAIEAAQRADLMLYPVFVYDRDVFRFGLSAPLAAGKRALQKLARDTGGSMLEEASLDANYARIGDELRNQYSLGFTFEAGKPGYRKLRVSVNQRGFTVQARDGYYA